MYQHVKAEHIEGENPNRLSGCAFKGCETVLSLRHMSLWAFTGEEKRFYAGFCGTAHALMCMGEETMSQA